MNVPSRLRRVLERYTTLVPPVEFPTRPRVAAPRRPQRRLAARSESLSQNIRESLVGPPSAPVGLPFPAGTGYLVDLFSSAAPETQVFGPSALGLPGVFRSEASTAPTAWSVQGPPSCDFPCVGRQLGRCLLTGVLAEGPGGVLFRAFHQTLRVPVAVRVARCEPATREKACDRLRREAHDLARIAHPGFVRVLDLDTDSLHPALVLELSEGVTLRELVEASGRLAPDRALALAAGLLDALAAARAAGIPLPALAPAGVQVTRSGPARITELVPAGGEREAVEALGVLLFHALTGEHPLAVALSAGAESAASAWLALAERIRRVSGLSAASLGIVCRFLSPDPAVQFPGLDAARAAFHGPLTKASA